MNKNSDNSKLNQIYCNAYHTNNGSINCITITNPSVTNIKPKLSSNIRQQTPFTFGQNGFGADIASILAPARRDRLLRPVFAELATEYKLRGPGACDRCVYRLKYKAN